MKDEQSNCDGYTANSSTYRNVFDDGYLDSEAVKRAINEMKKHPDLSEEARHGAIMGIATLAKYGGVKLSVHKMKDYSEGGLFRIQEKTHIIIMVAPEDHKLIVSSNEKE